jgi:hypothetical protein
MDIAFEILIPDGKKPSKISFHQPVFEWDGQAYPQGSEIASYFSFKLEKSFVADGILRWLPKALSGTEWQCISVHDGLEKIRNSVIENETGIELLELLKVLTEENTRWVIVFLPNQDDIHETGFGDIELVYEKIKSSLTVERKGFIIWHY